MRLLRTALGALCAATVATGIALSAPANADSATTGVISGRVTAPGMAKGDRIKVYLFSVTCYEQLASQTCATDTTSQAAASTVADAKGRYRFADLDTSALWGNYRVGFLDTRQQYAQQFAGHEAYSAGWQATTFQLSKGARVTVPALKLSRASTVRGTVTSPKGAAIAHPTVTVERLRNGREWTPWAPALSATSADSRYSHPQPRAVTTDATGHFAISFLPPGRYRISATDGTHLQTWYPSAGVEGESTTITVAAHSSTALRRSLRLLDGVRISGQLSASPTWDDMQLASLKLYRYDSATRAWTTDPSWLWGYWPNVDGAYTTPLLPPGTYRIGASLDSYADAFWKSGTSLATATDISAPDGADVRGINLALTALPQ